MNDDDLWAYINGKLVRGPEAVIPIYDRGVQWGDAVYDSIRTYGGQPFQVDFRVDRLFRSLYYARIDPGLSKEEFKAATAEVLERNLALAAPGEDIGLNYYVSRGSMKITDGLTPAGTVALFCRRLAFENFAKAYVRGAPGIIPTTRRTPPACVSPKAKVANKMNHTVAELEAKAQDPDAFAIMLDLDGNVTESTAANFLFISEGRIKIPDTRMVLSGADMAKLVEIAESLGIECDEGTYTTYDVYNADEAFLTTNSFGILPIVTINGLNVGDGKVGPMTRRLMRAWVDLVGMDFVAQALGALPEDEREDLEAEWRALANTA